MQTTFELVESRDQSAYSRQRLPSEPGKSRGSPEQTYVVSTTGFDTIGAFQLAGATQPQRRKHRYVGWDDGAITIYSKGKRRLYPSPREGPTQPTQRFLGRVTITGVTDGTNTFNINCISMAMATHSALSLTRFRMSWEGSAIANMPDATFSGSYVLATQRHDGTNEDESMRWAGYGRGVAALCFADLNWLEYLDGSNPLPGLTMFRSLHRSLRSGVSTGTGTRLRGLMYARPGGSRYIRRTTWSTLIP